MFSDSEENYLKAIFHLERFTKEGVSTNAIAEQMQTKASSVTDMLKKLSDKKLVNYIKYQGVTLSKEGRKTAANIIRKHRLWEVFLVEKLDFNWDEVHPIAEELEHIKSTELINRLEKFLGYPKHDPHGDPIPDKNGNFTPLQKLFVSDLKVGESAHIIGVKDSSPAFLQYSEKMKLILGIKITVLEKISFDNSVSIKIDDEKVLNISEHIAQNLYVMKE